MKKKLSAFTLAIVVALLFSACTGPAGSDGPQGPPGGNGVTNMTFYPFTMLPADWSPDTVIMGYQSIPVSIATLLKQAAANAQVEVYYSLSSPQGGPWNAMPYSGIWYIGPVQGSNDSIVDQLGYQFDYTNPQPGSIVLLYNFIFSNYHVYTQRPKANIYAMAAVIPQVVIKRHPNTNWKNATEVMQLPEAQAALVEAKKLMKNGQAGSNNQ